MTHSKAYNLAGILQYLQKEAAYNPAVAFTITGSGDLQIMTGGSGGGLTTGGSFAEYEGDSPFPQHAAQHKAEDIAFLSDEWQENSLAAVRIGGKTKHRMITRDKATGELYINYQQQRYYQSDFEPAAQTPAAAED